MRRYALLLYLSCWVNKSTLNSEQNDQIFLFAIFSQISVSISEPESCSREASRTVREYFTRVSLTNSS